MTGKLFINGIDAWNTWSVLLEDGSIDTLLSPPSAKPHIENKSRSIDGKQVLFKNPRVEDRDITLVFCVSRKYANGAVEQGDITGFQSKLSGFMAAICAGKTENNILSLTEIGVFETNLIYKLVYISATNLQSLNNSIGKIAIRFNEPNPTDRLVLNPLIQG
jgi:hypothetical protein